MSDLVGWGRRISRVEPTTCRIRDRANFFFLSLKGEMFAYATDCNTILLAVSVAIQAVTFWL